MGQTKPTMKCCMQPTGERGLTVIELIIVVTIIAVLAAMAAISVNYIRQARVSSATRTLIGDIQRARFSAMSEGPSTTTPQLRGYGIHFSPPQSYVFFAFNDANNDVQYSGAGEEVSPSTTTVPANVALSTDNSNNFPVLVYDKFGLPQRYKADGTQMTAAPAPGMVITLSDASIGYVKCINVTMNTIREGTWNGTTCVEQ